MKVPPPALPQSRRVSTTDAPPDDAVAAAPAPTGDTALRAELTAPDLDPTSATKVGVQTAGVTPGADVSAGNGAVDRFAVDGQLPVTAPATGPDAPPAAEVVAFLDDYGVTERLGRPRERIATWGARVHDGLEGATSPDALLDTIMGNDLRLQVFYLEGITKLYRKRYGAPMEKAYRSVKALEDCLGQYGAAVAHHAEGKARGLPPEAIAHLAVQEADARQAALDVLESGWCIDDDGQAPALKALVDDMVALDWDDYGDDRGYLKKELSRRLKKLDKADLNMDELQGDTGLHELRRQVRWFAIYATSLDGMVVHNPNDNPVAFYAPLLDSGVANSKYARLPEPTREKNPIELPRSLYLAVTKYISDIGSLKDEGEAVEGLALAFLGAGLAPDLPAAEKLALDELGWDEAKHHSVFERAHGIYDEIKDNDLIKSLRHAIKSAS